MKNNNEIYNIEQTINQLAHDHNYTGDIYPDDIIKLKKKWESGKLPQDEEEIKKEIELIFKEWGEFEDFEEEEQTKLDKIKSYLYGACDNDLLQIITDINGYDGTFEDLIFEENNEDFFNLYFKNDPLGAVRAAQYGDYNYMDDLVRFNVYGNLESMDERQVYEEIRDNIEEIANWLLENGYKIKNDIVDNELFEILFEDDED